MMIKEASLITARIQMMNNSVNLVTAKPEFKRTNNEDIEHFVIDQVDQIQQIKFYSIEH